jgi:16S rRNA A1518/A1519 N6-dimethyltransferase RsmA/KsgA/DIM1 with predicted DNA glycosylase/AP lyase activity
MVTGLFSFRRKQLIRGLRELTGWPAERVAGLLQQLALDPSHRPEVLSPAEFALLHQRLVDEGWRAG